MSSTDKTLHYSHRRLAYILGSIYFDWVDLSTSLASHTYVLKAPTLARFLCVHAIVYETNKPRFPLGHVWIIDNGSILSCELYTLCNVITSSNFPPRTDATTIIPSLILIGISIVCMRRRSVNKSVWEGFSLCEKPCKLTILLLGSSFHEWVVRIMNVQWYSLFLYVIFCFCFCFSGSTHEEAHEEVMLLLLFFYILSHSVSTVISFCKKKTTN